MGRISSRSITPRQRALDEGRDRHNAAQRADADIRYKRVMDYMADHPDASYADISRDVLGGVSRQRAAQIVRDARARYS